MPEMFDVVALLVPYPELGLEAGQVGTVVESYKGDAFEVEFSDDNGVTYALAAFPGKHLLKLLHDAPVEAVNAAA